jgi:serine/threonine protein kinase
MAPEVLDCPFKNKPEENKDKQELYYSLTVDAWAMGVLTYELLVGFPPFNDKQRAAIEDKIRSEQPRFPSGMSEPARSFVLRALQKDPLERPTATELLVHPWICAYKRGGGGAAALQRQQLQQQQQQRAGVQPLASIPPSPKSALKQPSPVTVLQGGEEGEGSPSSAGSSTPMDKLTSKVSTELR